ncbi:MAG: hypothetical protein IPI40_14790 [Betaproteobacteria bacterium]|nr:hypothetical protein [Betaproteobacteria bacterium]
MNDAPAAPRTDDDWLDAALRAAGRDHRDLYVADDGFTARVVAALPAPETVPAWRKPALIALCALTGVGAALPANWPSASRCWDRWRWPAPPGRCARTETRRHKGNRHAEATSRAIRGRVKKHSRLTALLQAQHDL